MLLCADGGLDNQGVEGVRDQGNSKVNLLEGLVQSSGIVHIEGDSLGVGEAFAELLGALEGSASCKSQKITIVSLCESKFCGVNEMFGIHPSGFSSHCDWYSGDHERCMQPLSKKGVISALCIRTNSDMHISLAENLNSGLGDYQSISQKSPM